MKKSALFVGVILAVMSSGSALAAKSSEFFQTYEDYNEQGRALLDQIEPRTGSIMLPDGIALDLKDRFYFLDSEDSLVVLRDMWGNPPSAVIGTQGMIFPVGRDPLAPEGWGIQLSMDKLGYVDDADATSIDYDDLLESMKQDTLAANDDRIKQGFEPITLIGWASPPAYDSFNKRLHWAKEVRFGDRAERTLNYDVRFLGREGVFVMSYIASIDELPKIKESLDEVLALPSFVEGKRYADYVLGADKVAAIGVGGLIAGKLAAKAGFLAVALVVLKKFGLFLIIPLAMLGQLARRLFSRGKDRSGT